MKVFISYTREDNEHNKWVENFAAALRCNGLDAILDTWDLPLGASITKFMETNIRESARILVICTPKLKEKADLRIGGAGYETGLMTGEKLNLSVEQKFIPILRRGTWKNAVPSFLLEQTGVDLREGSKYAENYKMLLAELCGTKPKAPPVKFDTDKLYIVIDHILGRTIQSGGRLEFKDGVLMSYERFDCLLSFIKGTAPYMSKGNWITFLSRSEVDKEIDGTFGRRYEYNELERMKIMELCAKSLKFRLKAQFNENPDNFEYKVMSNGDIYFRNIK